MSLTEPTSGPDVEATGLVPASREDVFEFLAALERHWAMAGRWIEVVSLTHSSPDHRSADGGVVRLRAPLGLRRTIRTKVDRQDPPDLIEGTATIGATQGHVRWKLDAEDGGTRVTLAARIETASPLDRVLLALGGRRWLRRHFKTTLAHLAAQFAPDPGTRD